MTLRTYHSFRSYTPLHWLLRAGAHHSTPFSGLEEAWQPANQIIMQLFPVQPWVKQTLDIVNNTPLDSKVSVRDSICIQCMNVCLFRNRESEHVGQKDCRPSSQCPWGYHDDNRFIPGQSESLCRYRWWNPQGLSTILTLHSVVGNIHVGWG